MVDILMFSACALFGIAVASVLAGLNKKPFGWIINMFSSALLTTGGFVCAAFVYTKLSHKELSFSSLFPDRVSLLIGMFFFIILSVIGGVFVGAVSGGGINRYMMRLYKSRVFYPIGALVLTLTIAVTCLCAYPLLASKNRADIVINEICHHNFNLICDSEENYSDYIELYNSGDNYVELSAFYLSDSPNEKDKFRLPEYILAPGEYILIWADSSDKGFSNDAIYANFSLSDNETVILSNSYNKTIDVEARTLAHIVRRQIIPSVIKFENTVATTLNQKQMLGLGLKNSAEASLIVNLSKTLDELYTAVSKLEYDLSVGHTKKSSEERAEYDKDVILADMRAVRNSTDELEKMIDKEIWPVPNYTEILNSVTY